MWVTALLLIAALAWTVKYAIENPLEMLAAAGILVVLGVVVYLHMVYLSGRST